MYSAPAKNIPRDWHSPGLQQTSQLSESQQGSSSSHGPSGSPCNAAGSSSNPEPRPGGSSASVLGTGSSGAVRSSGADLSPGEGALSGLGAAATAVVEMHATARHAIRMQGIVIHGTAMRGTAKHVLMKTLRRILERRVSIAKFPVLPARRLFATGARACRFTLPRDRQSGNPHWRNFRNNRQNQQSLRHRAARRWHRLLVSLRHPPAASWHPSGRLCAGQGAVAGRQRSNVSHLVVPFDMRSASFIGASGGQAETGQWRCLILLAHGSSRRAG